MSTVSRFETPLLRVSRPVSACQRCRGAKVRCDGKLPACTACERAGRSAECSSASDQFAKGKERSYVASLETRVEKLEKQLLQAKARNASMNASAALPGPSTETLVAHKVGSSGAQRKEALNVDDLVADFGFLSVNATARDFHGFSTEMSFARLVLSTSSLHDMPKFANNDLPQRYEITPLIKHYLENIHALYPFLSESKLFQSIDAVYQENGRHALPIDHWTIRLVLATATASLSRKMGDTHYQDAVRHAAAALDEIEAVVHPGSIVGIQAILQLVLYAMLDPHHFKSWYLIGLASRVMVDIGLHQDPPEELHLTFSELDMRLRVYDCVYALDRSISLVHIRAFSFTDDSASVTRPRQKMGSPDTSRIFLHDLNPAASLSHLRQIESHAYQKLIQSSRPALEEPWPIISRSIEDMHMFCSELPDQIRNPIKKLLRCEALYSSILILSPPDLDDDLTDYGKYLIFEYAVEYADLMSSIGSDAEPFAFYTSHDMLRASFVVKRLLALLLRDFALFFSSSVSRPPPQAPASSRAPVLQHRSVGEMLSRAYNCLNLCDKTLEYLERRFGYTDPLKEFRVQSTDMRQSLQTNYDNWNRNAPTIGHDHYALAGPSTGRRFS